MNTPDDSNQGSWFSTTDLKLAVSLHAAGFPFKQDGECTRIVRDGGESFTWHFEPVNREGGKIADFMRAWENPEAEGIERPEPMVCFLLAREAMFTRTHVISESHKVPQHMLLQRGDKRLLVTPRLGRTERESLAKMAS
jgi:hypothetical protein